MKRFVFIGLASMAVIYLIPLALVFFLQRSLMYFPPENYFPPQTMQLEAQEIALTSAGGDQVLGWWMPPKDSAQPVIMFFHGNGSAVYSNYDIYRDLQSQGYGVFAAGYAGYPGSGGKPSQKAILSGVEAQYDWIRDAGIAPERISFFGTSLGTGIAVQLALSRRPARLILEAPFNSTLDIGRLSMPVFPVSLLMKDTYRSDLALSHMDMPLIWMHGTKDDVIPLDQGQKLYEAYMGPKSHLIIEGGEHTNLWMLGGRDFVLSAMRGNDNN